MNFKKEHNAVKILLPTYRFLPSKNGDTKTNMKFIETKYAITNLLPIPIRVLRRARNTPRGDPTAKKVSTWHIN